MELAEALDRSLREKALADVRARANEVIPPDWDCVHCYECGDDIPTERARLGKFRCVSCQETRERGSKLYRR
jgi:RNA polymerase-binding transcription factor DksA